MKIGAGDQPFHLKAVQTEAHDIAESERIAETISPAHRVAEPTDLEAVPSNILDFASFARRMAAGVKSRQSKKKGKTRAQQVIEAYQSVAHLLSGEKPPEVEKFHRHV